jgi:molybdenum cofactor cytidylyltransferase
VIKGVNRFVEWALSGQGLSSYNGDRRSRNGTVWFEQMGLVGMNQAEVQVGGIVLAAGLSTRYGQNKLLQPLLGRPLFSYALTAALESKLAQVVLVCGQDLARQAPRHDNLLCRVNPDPQAGQAGSLHIGLEALGPGCSHVLFMLADQPLMNPALINRFCGLAGQGTALACLGWQDYLGPPSLFGREFFAELQSLSGDRGAGGVLRNHRRQLEVVRAPGGFHTWDVDRPQDLERVEKLLNEMTL